MPTAPPGPTRQDATPPRQRASWPRTGVLAAVSVALLGGIGLGWLARGGLAPLSPTPGRNERPQTTDAASNLTPTSDGLPVASGDDAARFWSALALSLASRSSSLERLLEELQNESANPRGALEQAIAASSDRELATIVGALTRIDKDELLADGDLRPFASRLVDVALDGLEGPSGEPPSDRRVVFTSTTRDFDPATSGEQAFPADQGRIFAMIDLEQHDGDRVMVKWLNTETRRIHSLQSMAYDARRPLWSYLSRGDAWDPGRYEVSFYTQDAQMRLLGRGEFTVVEAPGRG